MKMKKTFLIPAFTCICTTLMIFQVPCQVSTSPDATGNAATTTINSGQNSALPANTEGEYRNNISIRAVRDFLREYKDAKNVTWRKAKDGGYTARFNNDSVQTMVSYNRKGSCIYSSKKYAENKMPSRLRSQIKMAFSDYDITQVIEINLSPGIENVMYSVLIRYINHYKIIKINKGLLEIVSDYTLL